ncbi:Uncharacterised protein [Burkholderia pseudomallei]|nr:Uncharacterised protein [Burkholderia pseudomallei]
MSVAVSFKMVACVMSVAVSFKMVACVMSVAVSFKMVACVMSVAVSFKMVACVMSVAPAGADRTGPGAAAARRGTLRCSAAVSVSVESLVYTVKEALGLTFSRSRHSPDALVRASSRPLTDGAAAA